MVVPVLATRTDRTRFRDQHRRILVGTPQPPRVTDLVRQAQQGDQTAFQSLYREHVGRVYALCLRLTADASEAEELTQDAFVRAWERLATFRGESAFSSWVYRLTVVDLGSGGEVAAIRVPTTQRGEWAVPARVAVCGHCSAPPAARGAPAPGGL